MRNISKKDFEGIMLLHERAGDMNIHDQIDHDNLVFYKSMKQAAPILVELGRDASEAIRRGEASVKALENARMLAGRLVREWKETAAALRERGEAAQAEAYEMCVHALAELGIDQG